MQEFALGVELVAGVKLALTIPRLSPASSAAPAPAPASTDARSEARVQATGPAWHWWLLGGAGALLVAGGVVGAIAADQAGELKQRCPERNCPDGLSPVRDVKRTALIADGLYGASLLTAGIGLVLLLNESDGAAAPLGAGCAGGGCGVTLSGRF
jgi:hypothetical protein